MRHIAPAGTPIHLKDIRDWISCLLDSDEPLDRFRRDICGKYKVKYCFFMSTGRAALFMLLQVLREIAGCDRDEVVIPSYTCFSVASSIVRAGLKIRLCDIDINTLDYDARKLSELDYRRVLCIITANLYGIPNDLRYITRVARDNGVLLIDDAAQCMGGMVDNEFSGTFGDAGIFSLDKGKNITSIEGGIIVTNSDDIALALENKISSLPAQSTSTHILNMAKLLSYSIFLHPKMYWIPSNLPFLTLGKTIYSTKYPVEAYSTLLGAMGVQLFGRIDQITRTRRENAKYLYENLEYLSSIKIPEYKNYAKPVYLRFPVIANNKEMKDRIIERLNNLGIGASGSYPTSISEINEIQSVFVKVDNNSKNGREVARNIVTLPIHPYMKDKDLSTIVSEIKHVTVS